MYTLTGDFLSNEVSSFLTFNGDSLMGVASPLVGMVFSLVGVVICSSLTCRLIGYISLHVYHVI